MSAEKILKQKVAYAVYPAVKPYDYREVTNEETNEKEKKWKAVGQVLFGGYIKPEIRDGKFVTIEVKGKEWIKIRARNCSGYLQLKDMQPDRVLEVNFVDVGQGDGCHLVTPNDEHFIIDAGVSDNMLRFLNWRFNVRRAKTAPPTLTAVISHPDSDHYKGFQKLFKVQTGVEQQLKFDKVYHNGIIERSGEKDKLGEKHESDGINYIKEVFLEDQPLKDHLNSIDDGSLYEDTLNLALKHQDGIAFEGLTKSMDEGNVFLYESDEMSIEVLGPVTETINGKKMLRFFKGKTGKTDDIGRTKNGHSVVLKLTLGNLKVLLGGDLNPPAEDFLTEQYTGTDLAPLRQALKEAPTPEKKAKAQAAIDEVVEQAREFFQVDVAKSCHHGSADFTSEFLKAINPFATVISSGDDEPHCHPRPDTLGTIGKYSRGERSLIFSTELSRSGKEFLDISKLKTKTGRERLVTRYGMITLRSDGSRIVIAQMLERTKAAQLFDIHQFEWNDKLGTFEYLEK